MPGAPVGNYRWGVYAFFDYDGEPIYVGQTNEQLRTRIRRHLTNQRTDAVAMSVLDPFEVFEIAVWPLPRFEGVSSKDKAAAAAAKTHLDALERLITAQAVAIPASKRSSTRRTHRRARSKSRRHRPIAPSSFRTGFWSCAGIRTSASPVAR